MLSKPHVWRALEEKAAALAAYQRANHDERLEFESLLARLASLGPEEVRSSVAGVPRPGALPSAERAAGRSLIRSFGRRWANHEQARAWAMSVLRGTPTIAVDGSQVAPSRDFSLPVGAVQVAWFENAHEPSGTYTKDLRFEVLAPHELATPEPGFEEREAAGFPDLQVNLRRFELECLVLTEAMRRHAGHRPLPVCFLDGSLIVSFAAQLRPELRQRYVDSVRRLLAVSEETGVPLVGYVDSSYAKDLVALLAHIGQVPVPTTLSDSLLLSGLMEWGDRSEAFVCARDDRLFANGQGVGYYDQVLVVYCKTTTPNPPARLDLPAWVLEAGLLDHVIDIVRAECVIGTGYPYAAETADSVAVITAADRERFYRTLQEFAGQLGVELRYARKAYSKRGRR